MEKLEEVYFSVVCKGHIYAEGEPGGCGYQFPLEVILGVCVYVSGWMFVVVIPIKMTNTPTLYIYIHHNTITLYIACTCTCT